MAVFLNFRHLKLQLYFSCIAILRRLSQKASVFVYFLAVCLISLWMFRINQVPKDLIYLYESLKERGGNFSAGICQLPKLNPFDPSILQYVSKSEPLNCKRFQGDLTFLSLDGFLMVNETEVEKNGLSREDLRCRYREFWHNDGVNDDSTKFDDWQQLPIGRKSAKIRSDFVQVNCRHGRINLNVYNYHFGQISPKTESLSFANRVPAKISRKFEKISPPGAEKPKLSVIMIGIDSMSRSNFIRQLPKTYDFLINEMAATVFDGHVKVGDNTYVNVLAFLTGKRVWATKEFRSEIMDKPYMFFDDWTRFIWDDFTDEGYVTLYAEDRPDVALFNYKGYLCGFKYQPVTHYFRPYWLEVWWNTLHRRSSAFCYNQVPEHKIMLDYVQQFVRKYSGIRSWGLFWHSALGHELLNKIGVADEDFKSFFVNSQPFLNESIVLVISDHGHRYHSIRESVIGRLEARMPFFAVALPKWFKNRFPKAAENLKLNSQRLTTQFDVYETLKEIVNGTFDLVTSTDEAVLERNRAYSLFRRVPIMRQCHEAGIPEEYCPCYQEVFLEPHTSQEAQLAAQCLLDHVNSLLVQVGSKCAQYTLARIKDAARFLPHTRTLKDPQTGGRIPIRGFHLKYRVTIVVEPNGAQLEAVVKRSLDDDVFSVEGEVDRNNKYGNTSSCVIDRQMMKLCYCV